MSVFKCDFSDFDPVIKFTNEQTNGKWKLVPARPIDRVAVKNGYRSGVYIWKCCDRVLRIGCSFGKQGVYERARDHLRTTETLGMQFYKTHTCLTLEIYQLTMKATKAGKIYSILALERFLEDSKNPLFKSADPHPKPLKKPKVLKC
jgi:hypothetical protein